VSQGRAICLGVCATLALGSCQSVHKTDSTGGAVYERTPASTDIEALGKYIKFPVRPLAVAWETLSMSGQGAPGPTDWYLMAVLRYKEPDLDALAKSSESTNTPPVLDSNELRPWFPQDLKAAWTAGPGGQFQLQGPAYKASAFYKGPLHDGYFAIVPKTDELFLYIQCCTATIPKE
jgi:hypothetical protein